MATDEEGKQPEAEVTAVRQEPPALPAPTPEERLQTLQAELEKTQQSLKTSQGMLRQKDTTLKEQTDLRSEISGLKEYVELLATAMASGQQSVEDVADLPKPARSDIIQDLAKKKQQQTNQRLQEEAQRKGEEYRQRVETLGITSSDDLYYQIRNAVRGGEFDHADHLISKAEKEKKVPENKETEEQRINRMVEERLQAKLKEKGLLKTDGVPPGGPNKTFADLEAAYGKNPNDPIVRDNYLRARRERGI